MLALPQQARTTILSKRRGKGNLRVNVERRSLGPTPERLAKAGEAFVSVASADGQRIVVMRDAPLDRMYGRRAIEPVEYQALQKLKLHWHHSGMPGALRSADLNRVFATDLSAMSHMAASEQQAHHRQQWRRGIALLTPRAQMVVERVVCREQTIEFAGYALGETAKHRAIAAAAELLRESGYRLARLWGMR